MYDFISYNPTKIIFGRDKETHIGVELNRFGIKKVIFVYGQNSIIQSNLYSKIITSLNDMSIDYIDFDGVSLNPTLACINSGVEMAKSEGVDGVLAVGGGSVLDVGKGIAFGVKTDNEIWDHIIGKATITDALPIFTIPTIAASGSEGNSGAVITNKDTKQKRSISSPLLYPKVSIVNPELAFTVPLAHFNYGVVDIISHMLEPYITKKSGPEFQSRTTEKLVGATLKAHAEIMRDPYNYHARAELAWISILATNGSLLKGCEGYKFPVHLIEHVLSATRIPDIPHGKGLAYILPAWLESIDEDTPFRDTVIDWVRRYIP